MFDEWKNEVAFSQMRHNAIKMIDENYNWELIVKKFHQDLYSL